MFKRIFSVKINKHIVQSTIKQCIDFTDKSRYYLKRTPKSINLCLKISKVWSYIFQTEKLQDPHVCAKSQMTIFPLHLVCYV